MHVCPINYFYSMTPITKENSLGANEGKSLLDTHVTPDLVVPFTHYRQTLGAIS